MACFALTLAGYKDAEHLQIPVQTNRTRKFRRYQATDCFWDWIGLITTWSSGDLKFDNDPNHILILSLFASNLLSVSMLLGLYTFEVQCSPNVKLAYFYTVLALHLMFEDVFQIFVYLQIVLA
eukprot:160203-Amphidinium_carterae.1